MRGTHIVVPKTMRGQILQLAHEGHQGIVKMKVCLRQVWWPGIDRDVETVFLTCYSCQVVGSSAPRPPIKGTPFPESPWQELALDLLGPLPSGESKLMLVDNYSRFLFEVDILHATTSQSVMRCLDSHFARHSIPNGLKMGNGPQFVSGEFTSYLKEPGVKHHRTTPLWPKAKSKGESRSVHS